VEGFALPQLISLQVSPRPGCPETQDSATEPTEHFADEPANIVLAGAGERLFDDVADALGNFKVSSTITSARATHIEIVRR
jgi:hypothetical protein